MAETSGFFRAQLSNGSYDRSYTADQFAKYFSMFISNGIFVKNSSNLAVVSSSGMRISVLAGYAWVNGYWYSNDDLLQLTIGNSDGLLNRIDAIVVRWSNSGRSMNIVVKQGTSASSPVPPNMERNSTVYELCLAQIRVNKGASSITQSDIIDTRLDSELCGSVGALVEQWDMSSYGSQLNTYINDYMDRTNTEYEELKLQIEEWIATLESTMSSSDIGEIVIAVNNSIKYSMFTYVVENSQSLHDWIHNVSGNDYSRVLIKAGEYNLDENTVGTSSFMLNTVNTKYVYAETGNKLTVSSELNFDIFDGTGSTVKLENLYLFGAGSNWAGFSNVDGLKDCICEGINNGGTTGFKSCKNLTNCFTKYMKASYSDCVDMIGCNSEYGQFYNCERLTNCKAKIAVSDSNTSMACFYLCKNMTNCYADGEAYGSGSKAIAFSYCSKMVMCDYAQTMTKGYDDCSNNVNICVDSWDETNSVLYLKTV